MKTNKWMQGWIFWLQNEETIEILWINFWINPLTNLLVGMPCNLKAVKLACISL